MRRYFYYLVFVHMLVNGIGHTPRQLIANRFQGSIMSIFIAPIIGLLAMYTFSKSLSKFPNQGLPEILKGALPKWIVFPLLLYFSAAWLMSSLERILSFSFIIKRFVNPDMSLLLVQFGIILVVCLGALLKTEKILFLLEMLLVINLIFILFIFFKAYTNESLSWSDIFAALTYIKEPPNVTSLSAATYIFTGYINMVIFNRVVKEVLTWKTVLFLGMLGFVNLCTIMLIPIGFHGIDAVDDYIYPWITTADSMRMELGFIERVVYLYLFIYISISMGSVIVLWHVITELLKGILSLDANNAKGQIKASIIITIGFGLITLTLGRFLDEIFLYKSSIRWNNIRMFNEYLLVLLVFFLARRQKA